MFVFVIVINTFFKIDKWKVNQYTKILFINHEIYNIRNPEKKGKLYMNINSYSILFLDNDKMMWTCY